MPFPLSPPCGAYENERSLVYLYPRPRASSHGQQRPVSVTVARNCEPGTSSTRSVSPRLSEAPVSSTTRSLFRRDDLFRNQRATRRATPGVFELMLDENLNTVKYVWEKLVAWGIRVYPTYPIYLRPKKYNLILSGILLYVASREFF